MGRVFKFYLNWLLLRAIRTLMFNQGQFLVTIGVNIEGFNRQEMVG